jgi:hypothetical protein
MSERFKLYTKWYFDFFNTRTGLDIWEMSTFIENCVLAPQKTTFFEKGT